MFSKTVLTSFIFTGKGVESLESNVEHQDFNKDERLLGVDDRLPTP